MKLSEAIMDLYKNGSSFLRCDAQEANSFNKYLNNGVGVFYVYDLDNGAIVGEYSFYKGQTFNDALITGDCGDEVCKAMTQDMYTDRNSVYLHTPQSNFRLYYKTARGASVAGDDDIVDNDIFYIYMEE